MENRQVGYIIIGMAVVIGIIIFLFNSALKDIVGTSCSHGTTCPMYGDIKTQTIIGLVLVGIIAIIGIVLIFGKEKEKIIVRTRKIKDELAEKLKEEKEKNLKLLNKEEKAIYVILMKEGSMFQADIVDKSGFGKVKVTRILDRLESKNLIERKRRGMNNIVVIR
ncbi:MarR family transcriptional regulator [Candidatus Pacearchaeota archaeon]|nr:MarR family transcriptional regulator [Candidatus Pacearchaeota archaeon]